MLLLYATMKKLPHLGMARIVAAEINDCFVGETIVDDFFTVTLETVSVTLLGVNMRLYTVLEVPIVSTTAYNSDVVFDGLLQKLINSLTAKHSIASKYEEVSFRFST